MKSVLAATWQPAVRPAPQNVLAIPDSVYERPSTPPASAFRPGTEITRLTEEVQQLFSKIRDLGPSLDLAVADAQALERDSFAQSRAAKTSVTEATTLPDAILALNDRQVQLAVELRRCAQVVSRIGRSLCLVSIAFQHLPPIPMNENALMEMLRVLHAAASLGPMNIGASLALLPLPIFLLP